MQLVDPSNTSPPPHRQTVLQFFTPLFAQSVLGLDRPLSPEEIDKRLETISSNVRAKLKAEIRDPKQVDDTFDQFCQEFRAALQSPKTDGEF